MIVGLHRLADDLMIADRLIGANVLKNVALDEVVAMIAQEPHAMFQMVVESMIHAGLGQLRWNEILLAYAHESLNLIFQNTLQVKNLRRVFVQSC
jgi:hypothetical protein